MREGVCLGEITSKYCPWNQFVHERSTKFKTWLKSWVPTDFEYLEPKDWYSRGHDHDSGHYDKQGFWRYTINSKPYGWDLALAIADVALEELRKARVKRQISAHLIFVPKLFTHLWRKQLIKTCDIICEITSGYQYWSHDQFEPLTF